MDAKRVDYASLELPEILPRWHWRWYLYKTLHQMIRRGLENAGLDAGMSVLDFGCGARPYERFVLSSGAVYLGADVRENPKADVHLDDGGIVPAPGAGCDIVLSTQVLEHVPNPQAYLLEAFRLLRPGGRLVLSTHGFWRYHPTPTDYWRWTHVGLRKQIMDAGFSIGHSEGMIGLLAGGLHLIQDYLHAKTQRLWLRRCIAYVFQPLIAFSDRKLHTQADRDRNAMIYMVVAVRP